MLSNRATETLGHLARFSMLSAEQLGYAMGRGRSTSTAALTELRQMGLVCYCGINRPDQPLDRVSKPYRLYSLNRKGMERAAAEGLITPDLVRALGQEPVVRNWKPATRINPEFHHRQGVVDIMIAYWRAIMRRRGRYEVMRLTPDFIRRVEGGKKPAATDDKNRDGKAVRVDAFFMHRNLAAGETIDMCVEFDRETCRVEGDETKRNTVTEKLRKLEAYIGAPNRFLPTGDLSAVLYVTMSAGRIGAIRDAIDWRRHPNLEATIRFAVLRHLKDDFLGAVWQDVEGRFSPLAGPIRDAA